MGTPMKKFRKARGFTLVEVMIAVLLLGFGLLAAAQMQGSSIRYNAMGRQLTSAIAYAQSVMESERASATTPESFDQIQPGAQVVAYGQDTNYPDFQRTVTVANGTGNPPSSKNITVTIDWRGYMVRSYSIRSVIARPLPSKYPSS